MTWRLLAAVLLAANLLLGGWLLFKQPDRAAPGRAAAALPGAPALQLVAEIPAEQRTALEKRPAEPVPAAPTTVPAPGSIAVEPGGLTCVTLGPFSSNDAAINAASLLRASGVVIEVREEPGQLRSGYWVHLPPYPTREAAEAVSAELAQKGAGDLFIVAAAEQRHAISLGLFTSPERADQRAAEIGKLGYRPRVAERFRDGAVYFLEYREPAELALDVAPALEVADPEARRTATPCP
jgi:hypothetical protein